MIPGADSYPLHAGGQRLYYRSYKAEAAGHKALVTLVFHHGYGCYCGFYDKGKVEEMAERRRKQELFEWPYHMYEHSIHHEPSMIKPLSTSCNPELQCYADYRTLQKRGFSVFAFDAHSFGKSEPLEPAYMRSYVMSPHHLVDDVYSYVRVSWPCQHRS